MKKYTIAILVFAVVTIGVVFAFAQKRDGSGARGERHFGPPPFVLEKIASELDLSDEQRAQVKQILEAEKAKIQTLTEAARGTHDQLKDLGTDGVFNEEQVNRLAAEQSETMRQLIIEKERVKAAIFAVLTPEQRAKASEMKNKFGEKMRGGFGRRFGRGGDFEPKL
ncbi:MAG: Spy/CpxP family protein refolding chaperone [Acidobacteriota bacterium]|nr:Spy/CpxP family protein refolding chaperone [Acidobacteriota bacterium]